MKFFCTSLIASFMLSSAAFAAAVSSEDAAVKSAQSAVKAHNLTKLSANCVTYAVDKQDTKYWYVEAREKHDATCGGDAATSPRLFTLRIAKKNGAVQSDQMLERYDFDGAFHPLP